MSAALGPGEGAPYGYGRATLDGGGRLVHALAEPWKVMVLPGRPGSLWPQEREPRTVATAWARCGKGLEWKADGPEDAPDAVVCPRCTGARSLDHCRVDWPVEAVA